MKKGSRTALQAAVCCILAGAVLTGSGCVGLYHGNYNGNGYYTGAAEEPGQEVYSGDFDQKLSDTGDIKALEVETGLHQIRVQEGTDQSTRLKGRNADQIQCYVKDGRLYLKEVGRKKIPEKSQDRRLVLTLPAGFEAEEAVLDAQMGSVEMSALRASVIELNADMGNVEIDELTAAGKARLSADMGNITVKNGTAAELKADADMGNIEWEGTLEGNAVLSSDMGNLKLTLHQEKKDFNFTISSDMGNVELDGTSYGGFSGSKRIDNGAEWHMSLDSSMGSIEIDFR